MAIEYDLEFATKLSSAEVATRLVEIGKDTGVLDASVTPEQLTGLRVNSRLDTWMGVIQKRELHSWHPIVTDLGFTPTVSVGFRMAKGVEVSDQQDDMLRLVLPLLEQVDGDAVLHYQFEQIWLLRKNGDLTLSEDDDLWRPHRLPLVTQPYRRETHRFED
ncbi:hypothetical protein OK074_5824 [Actinobacteria bacterium OK074]|nr:hypothetical protein OK074_5824 [Actinobacteria bacterium OK074]